jgi:hypothetical protein
MAADQDWCLSCGTAAPGRLGQRPGWRAAVTVLALTLVLVAGSVAAAYAALTSDATQEASAPPPPDVSPVAQAAPATPPSSATPPAPKLPTVQAPPSTAAPTTPATPVTPTPAPQTVAPATPPSSGSGAGATGGQGTVALPAPVTIKLPSDAGSLYDPSQLVVAPVDPALPGRALDGKPSTAFTLTPTRPEWGVGYVVDLQKPHGLRTLEITTSTPGFRVEVYATDLATPPPTVTDARWAHLADRRAVGAHGKPDTLRLDDGATTYRTVLVWVTKGPSRGDRVALGELKITR